MTAVAKVLAWCFYSPRRLFALVLAVLAVLIGVGAAVQAALPSAEPAASGVPAGVAGGSADAEQAVQAALAFSRAWASKPASVSAEQWRQGLAPLTTPDLLRGLALTDPAALPGGGPTGRPTVRFVSVSSSLVEVPLSSGRRVLVTVVVLHGRWVASDVQPLAGDSGDVPVSAGSASAGSASTGSASAG